MDTTRPTKWHNKLIKRTGASKRQGENNEEEKNSGCGYIPKWIYRGWKN